MDILSAAKILRPGTNWNLSGNVLTQAIDGTERVSVPTMEEIQELLDADKYKELRQPLYPAISEGLDALVHKENGNSAPWEAYVAACNKVKTQYPKPE